MTHRRLTLFLSVFAITQYVVLEHSLESTTNSRLVQAGGEKNRTYPSTIAGLPITRVIDLTTGYDSGNPPTYEPSLPLSAGHMVQFRAGTESDVARLVFTIRYVSMLGSSSFTHPVTGRVELSRRSSITWRAVDRKKLSWLKCWFRLPKSLRRSGWKPTSMDY